MSTRKKIIKFLSLHDIKRIDKDLMIGSVHSERLSNYKIKGDTFMQVLLQIVLRQLGNVFLFHIQGT